MPNLDNEYKTIFLGKWGKPGNYYTGILLPIVSIGC